MPDTLYYDGLCSLCTREIRTLRRLQHGQLDFADIPLLWPGIRPLAERIYRAWAERRYRRLYACSVCMGAEE